MSGCILVSHKLLVDSPVRFLFPACGATPNSLDYGEEVHGLSVIVVFTTVPETLVSLRHAGELAQQLGARIRILVPHVVPYPLPLDCPQVAPDFKVRHFRTVSVNGAIETHIDVRLCRDFYDGVIHGLCPQSVVLIGGRNHWWPTREKRLARRLGLAGHHVIFVQQQ